MKYFYRFLMVIAVVIVIAVIIDCGNVVGFQPYWKGCDFEYAGSRQ